MRCVLHRCQSFSEAGHGCIGGPAGKVFLMKRMILFVCALALMTTGVVGCHASGDIGTNGGSLSHVSLAK